MWPISDTFRDALTRDHFVVAKADILEGEQVLYSLDGEGVLVDGSVTCSRSAVQRTASVSIIDRDGSLSPRDVNDLLVPSGRQIRLYRGIMFNDRLVSGAADVEYVPIGTFRFTVAEVDFPMVSLSTADDRSWIISGEKTPFILAVTPNTNVIDVITQLIQTAYPGCPMNFPVTNELSNGMTFDAEADPWEICQKLAANLGYRLYFDPMGVATMRPEPNESDPPVWSYDDLDPSNIGLPGVKRTWTGEGFNGVIVVAENSDLPAPIMAFALDNDPNSPTQWGGPFGKRYAPFIRDETIGSLAQAQWRADVELRSRIGFMQSIDVPTLPNPAYEVGDVIRVSYARPDLTDDPVIAEQFCIVDSFSVPLVGNQQTLQTRARRIVQPLT
jgi:Domain of unknown function (DUF5047)